MYLLSEVDSLIFDAVALMITIAIVDDAFEHEVISIKALFQKRVLPPRRSLHLKWKKEMLKVPIFRQAVPSPQGVRTAPGKALRYYTYLYYLQRLGLLVGFPQLLGPYDIRRGSGEAVDGKLLESVFIILANTYSSCRKPGCTTTSHGP